MNVRYLAATVCLGALCWAILWTMGASTALTAVLVLPLVAAALIGERDERGEG